MPRLYSQLVLAVLIATFGAGEAQASGDSQLWTTANASFRLGDKWKVSQELTARFSDHRNGIYEIEAITMLGYKLSKLVTISGGYVHNPQYAAGEFRVMEHRFREQLQFDNFAMIGSGKLSARVRLEQRWRDHVAGTAWRLRPYLKYSLPLGASKIALNLSNETFINLKNTGFQRTNGIDRMRNMVSLSAPLTKNLSIEGGYLNQHGFVSGGNDTVDHVALLSMSLSL